MKNRSYVMYVFLSCLAFINSAIAASPEPGAVESRLLQQLSEATTEAQGRRAESRVWEFWFDESPTDAARQLLDEGKKRRESYDYAAAEYIFNKLVESEPGYAEGYNQRAFVRFLREDFEGSLADLEVTLQMKPWHFGALSGMYHVLRIQNRHSVAFDMLARAVALHPWIQERGALPESRWPKQYRMLREGRQEI